MENPALRRYDLISDDNISSQYDCARTKTGDANKVVVGDMYPLDPSAGLFPIDPAKVGRGKDRGNSIQDRENPMKSSTLHWRRFAAKPILFCRPRKWIFQRHRN